MKCLECNKEIGKRGFFCKECIKKKELSVPRDKNGNFVIDLSSPITREAFNTIIKIDKKSLEGKE